MKDRMKGLLQGTPPGGEGAEQQPQSEFAPGPDAPSRDYVVHLVPAVPRFILLHVLGVRCRHRFAGLWKGSGAESIPSQPIPSDV